ncbi:MULTISPECIES: SigE family RNA polymerase sigma factor [unclassified Modestobacter]
MRRERDEAFSAFVAGSRGDLLRTATLLAAGDRHLAEDLVQVSLTRLYLAWPRLRAPEARFAYARRVLVNALIDETRRPWRRREQPRAELPDAPAPAAGGPDDERLARLRPALEQLPPRMRAAVVFRHLHELSVAETADVLNCSQGTVKSQTARGLDQLRRALAVPPTDPPEDGPPPSRPAPASALTPATTWSAP